MTVGTLRSMNTPVAPVITDPQPWIEQAACREVGPGPWDTTGEGLSLDNRRALGICRTCPVRDLCRDFADRLESTSRANIECIFGGETPSQRAARRQKTVQHCSRCGNRLLRRSKYEVIRESGLCFTCFAELHPRTWNQLRQQGVAA